MPALELHRRGDASLAEQLERHFAAAIRARALGPGTRLPSIRECATQHGLSASTVVAAYDRLLAAGLVQSRAQRGFFVRDGAPRAAASQAAEAPRPMPTSATALIRGMFQAQQDRPMPGLGTLPADWLDLPVLQQALRRVTTQAADTGAGLHYGDPQGQPRLRQALVARLDELGISATSGQIVTTLGATHALDIITRTLLRPGDPVLVDEPGWAVEYARLAAAGMRLLPVPRGEAGPDLAAMQRLVQAHAPKLYVTVSVLHNPTGASLSLQAAHRVLELAHAHGLHIVEDDTYSHLAGPALPRLCALDGLRRTLYVSGFSKILAPGWRVGYLAAPPAWVDALVDTKLLSTLTTPSPTELALAHCLENGGLRRHAERIQQQLAAARERTVKLAQQHGFGFAATPRGLFGWVELGADSDAAARHMMNQGWLLAPGSLFQATPGARSTLMRVNFATSQSPNFWSALRTWATAEGEPSQGGLA